MKKVCLFTLDGTGIKSKIRHLYLRSKAGACSRTWNGIPFIDLANRQILNVSVI